MPSHRTATTASPRVKAKREDKRLELTRHAALLLSQRGYANTSLREIAKLSGVSLGVLHYYFKDREELIISCVRLYKEEFIGGLEQAVSAASGPGDLSRRVIELLAVAIGEKGQRHRLWFDMRAQALFDARFHAIVAEIETAMIELSRQLLMLLGAEHIGASYFYVSLDGLFRFWLQRFLAGDAAAVAAFRQQAGELLASVGRAA